MASVALFPSPEDVGPREWGKETLLVLAPGKYTLKKIEMKKGAKGGLQYHRLKDEAGYMLMGAMRVTYSVGHNLASHICRAGDCFHFPAGSVHQAEAITDCTYVEASTPHFNDRVHVERDFGIEDEAGGLPSTRLEDIETK
jgi:mannose-6-phosphate isomerase